MTELPDRLLRDALRPGAPAASNVCADVDALAAWADGTMSSAARATFESHAADCARCQALMAAMARTEPPSIEPSWRPRPLFSWLIPLAAATAAIVVVLSLAVTERGVPAAPVARVQSTPPTPSLTEGGPPSRLTAPSVHASEAPRAPGSGTADSRHDHVPLIARAAQPQKEQNEQKKLKDATDLPAPKTEQRAQVAESTTAAPQAAPAPPPATPAVQTPTAQTPPTPPSAASAPAAAKDVVISAPAGAAKATANEESLLVRANPRDASRLAMKAAASAPLLIASPGRDSQWRIVENAFEHTSDGGATWQKQPLGADESVRAGRSPAAGVCWLVGARGLVLLTTSGTDWRRIEFPESVDLVAIEATDSSHATVTTATGHRFSTADSGKTWIRQ